MTKNNHLLIISAVIFYELFEKFSASAFIAFTPAVLISLYVRKINIEEMEFFSVISICSAIISTILFTNIYFGIGSYGNTCFEMIKNYLSLGFHPNWRGILYGTIVMVIIITTPRKFKNKITTFSAAMIGIIITGIMNVILISDKEYSPISEFNLFKLISSFQQNLTIIDILIITFSGIIIGLSLKLHFKIKTKNVQSRLITTSVTAFAIIVTFVGRVPSAAIGVSVITAAWQGIDWKKLSSSLKQTPKLILIVLFTLSSVFIGTTYPVAFLLIYSFCKCYYRKYRLQHKPENL